MCGLGSSSVISIPVDHHGKMIPSALEAAILAAKSRSHTPFFVNATAGTTVLGSYDPFPAISTICKSYNLWLHIDASWGGPAIFSPTHKHSLNGSHLANSLAINPHKMMNVPLICSFLLTNDLTTFHRANTLPAGYLFHSTDGDGEGSPENHHNDQNGHTTTTTVPEVWDLADLTLQCGRRGDSLKLALSWIYYGIAGFSSQIDTAFSTAAYLTSILSQKQHFVLVSENPPPCLQVCFYYIRTDGKSKFEGDLPPEDALRKESDLEREGPLRNDGRETAEEANSRDGKGELGDEKKRKVGLEKEKERNTRITKEVVSKLVVRGFMVDYAPGEKGAFFRVVVNVQTRRETVEGLVTAIEEIGAEVV